MQMGGAGETGEGAQMAEMMKKMIKVEFSPVFYVSILLFLATGILALYLNSQQSTFDVDAYLQEQEILPPPIEDYVSPTAIANTSTDENTTAEPKQDEA